MPRSLSLAAFACAVAAFAGWVLWPAPEPRASVPVVDEPAKVEATSQSALLESVSNDRQAEPVPESFEPAVLDLPEERITYRSGRGGSLFSNGPFATLAFEFEYERIRPADQHPEYSLELNTRENGLTYSAPGSQYRSFRGIPRYRADVGYQVSSSNGGRHEFCIKWDRENSVWYSRQLVELIPDETVQAAPIEFVDSQELSILIGQTDGFAAQGKLDQERVSVTLFGPIKADGTVDFAPIRERVSMGEPLKVVGMQPGRWAIEVGTIVNTVDGKRYGANHNKTIYEFDWNGQHEFQHLVEADANLKDVQLKLVRTYPDRPAAVPSIAYRITPLENPEATMLGSVSLLRTQASVTQEMRLWPGRYQFSIVPSGVSRWGGGYCGTGEFEVKEDGELCEVLVVAEARTQLKAQRLNGQAIPNLIVSGVIQSIGPVQLWQPVRLNHETGSSGSCMISGLPIGSSLLIDVSEETVVVNKDREVVVMFSDEQLREMGVELDE